MNAILKSKILELYKGGMSLRDIGTKLHLSHEAIRHEIPKHLIRSKRMGEKEINKIIEVFKETDSYQETAERLGLEGRQVVYRVIKNNFKKGKK